MSEKQIVTIDGQKFEIEQVVADLIISISKERDELKATFNQKKHIHPKRTKK